MNKESKSSSRVQNLGAAYWNERWKNNRTSWDIGYASPALVNYFKEPLNKDQAILVPGCGNAYEVEALLKLGYTDITLIDISKELVKKIEEKFVNQLGVHVLLGDFFMHQGNYDLIMEQTFFCAIHPSRRPDYVRQVRKLLKPGGTLVGLLFNREFANDGPPFGGQEEEYRSLFEPYFHIEILENCENSIPARRGTELFVKLERKNN